MKGIRLHPLVDFALRHRHPLDWVSPRRAKGPRAGGVRAVRADSRSASRVRFHDEGRRG
jgi:hypothetical protein